MVDTAAPMIMILWGISTTLGRIPKNCDRTGDVTVNIAALKCKSPLEKSFGLRIDTGALR